MVASSPPVARIMRWLASIPREPRTAVAFVAFISLISSLLSWGFSLIFSAMLAKETARRRPEADYRSRVLIGHTCHMALGSHIAPLELSSVSRTHHLRRPRPLGRMSPCLPPHPRSSASAPSSSPARAPHRVARIAKDRKLARANLGGYYFGWDLNKWTKVVNTIMSKWADSLR